MSHNEVVSWTALFFYDIYWREAMKRFCFAFVLIVFSFVLLSCQNHATDSPSRGNEEETDPDNTHGDHTKKSKPDKDHDPTQSQDPTPAYGELAGEENLAFFYNAMEIYSWKAMGVTGFELDYSKKTTGGDTVIYTKVAGGAYDTMEKVDFPILWVQKSKTDYFGRQMARCMWSMQRGDLISPLWAKPCI